VVLQGSLEALESERNALESERKARSEVDQEVLALRGRVLGTGETNARLHKLVTRQEEGLSILKNTHLSMYLFHFWFMSCFPFNFLLSSSSFFQNWAERLGHWSRTWR